MELIAVVMHADTSAHRFESAQALLNWGFANYTLRTIKPEEVIPPVPVILGTSDAVQPVLAEEPTVLLQKGQAGTMSQSFSLPSSVNAPVKAGDTLGTFSVTIDGSETVEIPLVAATDVPRLGLADIFTRILLSLFEE